MDEETQVQAIADTPEAAATVEAAPEPAAGPQKLAHEVACAHCGQSQGHHTVWCPNAPQSHKGGLTQTFE